MIDEGYTKFHVDWTRCNPHEIPEVAILNRWRPPLYEAGLIGYDEVHDVGYGNISVRVGDGDRFVISGTQTGQLPVLYPQHYALVTDVDIEANRVRCEGPVQASSESMTHAGIYRLSPGIGAIVHVHSEDLWLRLNGAVPTSDPAIAYGTPGMAREFARLWQETEFPAARVAVMAGHRGGLITIGGDIEEAASRILTLHAQSGEQEETR